MIARIASPLEQIRDHYTVVVVGSGYGGAIANFSGNALPCRGIQ